MADKSINNQPLPDDVWQAAKMLWENTPEITYDEVIDILRPIHGDNTPKNKGSISKRKSKEKWVKKNTLKALKEETKGNARAKPSGNRKKSGNHATKNTTNVSTKTNKAQNTETSLAEETLNGKLDEIMDNVVMGAKDRAAVIVKTRKRYKNLGHLFDQSLAITLSIKDLAEKALQAEIDMNKAGASNDERKQAELENAAEIAVEALKRALMLSKSLTDATTSLSISLKTISEVELPLCGITPEDFSQSDQERRLGALEALGDINAEEEEARVRLKAELDDRLEWIKETASSGDFGRTPEPDGDDIEEIDYTQVDDD